jgi:chemotaxis family two-component system response regulator Rcp1
LCSPGESQSDTATAAEAPQILLVEDNAADIGLVREALEEHHVRCSLIVITTGERAIAFINEIDSGVRVCPKLVIVDLNLPKRSGKEVLKRMRMSSTCTALPVIVLTSSENQKDKDDVAVFRPTGYFRKPSRLDEFLKLGTVFKQIVNAESAGGA